MRKYLITSACTLGLSLFGAFGSNQNSLNLDKLNNTNSNTTQVVQSVTNTDDNQSLKDIITSSKGKASVNSNSETKTSTKASTKKPVKASKKKPAKASTKKPTKAPAKTPVATPTPTKAPVATATPTPTKAPVATTAPTPTVKPSNTANTSSNSSYASEVLRLVNIERAKAGLSAYTTNQTITAAANKRAQETAVSFSHTRPNGSSFSSVLKEYGISFMAAGENIAYGQKTPQEVVTGWMNSPGHRANILNANFGKIGIGVYQKNGVYYWTQEFTN